MRTEIIVKLFLCILWCSLLVGCSTTEQFEGHENAGDRLHSSSESHVIVVVDDYGIKDDGKGGLGSGVVVHSSKAKGTYVLTCWHIASVPVNIVRRGWHGSASGPVGVPITVGVDGTCAVLSDETPYEEGDDGRTYVTGTVAYSEVVGFPIELEDAPPEVKQADDDPLLYAWGVYDVAIIHIKGLSGLKSMKISIKDASGRTDCYIEGMNYDDTVLYSVSASKVYSCHITSHPVYSGNVLTDRQGINVYGIVWGELEVPSGNNRYRFATYTPSTSIVDGLTKAGYGWLVDQS